MYHRNYFIRLTVCALLAAWVNLLPAQEEKKEPSNTRRDSRIIRITNSPIEAPLLETLLETTCRFKVADKILKPDPDLGDDLYKLTVEPISNEKNSIAFRLSIDIEDTSLPPQAVETLDGIVDYLKQALRTAHEENFDRQRETMDNLEMIKAEYEARLKDMQAQLRAMRQKAGRSDLSRQVILEEIHELELQARQLEQDLTANQARAEAILMEMDRTRKQTSEKQNDDAVVQQLRDIVTMREEENQYMAKLVEVGLKPAGSSPAEQPRSIAEAMPQVKPNPSAPAAPADSLRQITQVKLNVKMDMNFDSMELTEVLDNLTQTAGVNLFVDWNQLNSFEITNDALVTLQCKEISLRKALELALRAVSSGKNGKALFTVDDEGVVEVSAEANPMQVYGMNGGSAQSGSQNEVMNARLKLAQARAELAQRLQTVQQETGGEIISQLTSMLSQMTIDTAEKTARFQYIRRKQEEIRATNLLELADQYETEIRFRMSPLEDAYKAASMAIFRADQELRDFSANDPQVTVIGQ